MKAYKTNKTDFRGLSRKIKRIRFWINGYLFHADDIIRGTYSPKKQSYTPINKYQSILNRPHLPEEPSGEYDNLFYLFVIFAFMYLFFGLLFR